MKTRHKETISTPEKETIPTPEFSKKRKISTTTSRNQFPLHQTVQGIAGDFYSCKKTSISNRYFKTHSLTDSPVFVYDLENELQIIANVFRRENVEQVKFSKEFRKLDDVNTNLFINFAGTHLEHTTGLTLFPFSLNLTAESFGRIAKTNFSHFVSQVFVKQISRKLNRTVDLSAVFEIHASLKQDDIFLNKAPTFKPHLHGFVLLSPVELPVFKATIKALNVGKKPHKELSVTTELKSRIAGTQATTAFNNDLSYHAYQTKNLQTLKTLHSDSNSKLLTNYRKKMGFTEKLAPNFTYASNGIKQAASDIYSQFVTIHAATDIQWLPAAPEKVKRKYNRKPTPDFESMSDLELDAVVEAMLCEKETKVIDAKKWRDYWQAKKQDDYRREQKRNRHFTCGIRSDDLSAKLRYDL